MSILQTSVTTNNRILFDNALETFFTRKKNAATQLGQQYERLWDELERQVNAGGKRLRPDMVFLAYGAYGGTEFDKIAPIAAAQELLHQSLLMHDDIIDRDYIRHGVINIQGSYRNHYAQYVSDETDVNHFAASAAILGGDLLLAGAYELMASAEVPNETIQDIQQLFSQGVFAVSGGELLDVESTFLPHNQINTISIATNKTASYSFIAPLLIGATLANATKDQKKILAKFAESLGIAFQLKDDLLGVFGNEKVTGKSTTGDITEGKFTYLVETFYKHANETDQTLFEKYFGKHDATIKEINHAKELLQTSGARQLTEKKAKIYQQTCDQILSMLEIDNNYKKQFAQLIERSLQREN